MKKSRKRSYENKQLSNRPKKLRQWDNESMLNALDAVASGEMGVNRAALEFGVLCTTLKGRVSGRVVHGTNVGPKPYLCYEEEKELVEHLVTLSKMGYGKTRLDVLKLVETALLKKGVQLKGCLSQGWWVRFRQRWPELRLRKGDSFPIVREQATTYSVFKDYFDLLDETLTKNGLKDKPAQIYNCDESGMPLQHKMPKIITVKGTKKVRQCSSGNKTQITILGCANGAGQSIPPMVVFTGKNFNHMLSKGEVPGTLYGMSPNGWMDQELFAEWFSNHFLMHAVTARPLLLMLDGHSSHYTLDLVKSAAEKNVIIFCLPPHTTADSQPLDTSCFGPLKTYWFEVCRQYLFSNPGRVITKFQFSTLFAKAWSKGMTIENIISGFRHTGIYPFKPSAILDKFAKPKDNSTPKLKETESDSGNSSKNKSTCSQPSEITFTPETIKLYEKRLENGYDVYDKNYIIWLEKFHPDCLPSIGMLQLIFFILVYFIVCLQMYCTASPMT